MANYTEFVFGESGQGDQALSAPPRRPYRPPIGIPTPWHESKWKGSLASIVLHVLVLLLILGPIFAPDIVAELLDQGAGGPGPAGGGGGGRNGSGGAQANERLRFIQVAPPPPAPAPAATIPPIVAPPKEEVAPQLTPKIDIKTDVPVTDKIDMALTSGIGGGTGRDGSGGTGPGSGGGVGSGVGTGRGSSVGPGTGGGEGTIYPPTLLQTFLPPYPIPQKVKPFHLVAVFEVSESGDVVRFDFNPTKDAGYNRRLKEVLTEVRFRPATKWDGTPVRAKTQVEYFF